MRSGKINSTGPGGGLDASEVPEGTHGTPYPISSHSAVKKSGSDPDPAETIADLRAALRDREQEIVWLKDELRHADQLLLERARTAARGGWTQCPAGGGHIRKADE